MRHQPDTWSIEREDEDLLVFHHRSYDLKAGIEHVHETKLLLGDVVKLHGGGASDTSDICTG